MVSKEMKVLDAVRDVIGLLVLEGTIEKSLGEGIQSRNDIWVVSGHVVKS